MISSPHQKPHPDYTATVVRARGTPAMTTTRPASAQHSSEGSLRGDRLSGSPAGVSATTGRRGRLPGIARRPWRRTRDPAPGVGAAPGNVEAGLRGGGAPAPAGSAVLARVPGPARASVPARASAGSAPPPPHESRTAVLPLAARRALGGLLPLLDDPELRDLLVQVRAGRGELWVDRRGQLDPVSGWEAAPEAVHRLATALIAAGGRHLDELHPCADVRLGDGMRVHAVLPPVAVAGAAVSIRVPRITALDFDTLVRSGLCDSRAAALFRNAVRKRSNILITGGTGTGKTTVLAALLSLAGANERIVTIEDLAELRLTHPHSVALEARQSSAEGLGLVTLDDLLREALRMRPDRIALGECRGAEIATLLTALNTGHDGGAGTLHASQIGEVPARLEALGASAGMRSHELARQAVSAIDLVVHLTRVSGRPRVAAVGRLRIGANQGLAIEVKRLCTGSDTG